MATNFYNKVVVGGGGGGGAVNSVNGYTGTVVLGKADIGLNNVDNTSDANKPISTATQTALNDKVNKSGDTMTGALIVSGSVTTGNAMLRVTNTGLGDTFVVEDSANPDASNFKIDSNGFIFTGSLLSTSGTSGRMQILDLSNAFIECKAGSTRAVSFGASTTGNGFRSSLGPLDISTTDSGDAITISPVQGDGFGSSIYTTSNGSMLVTGINNITPTEALDVSGNIKASGTITGSNLSGTNTGNVTIGTANGLSIVGQALSLQLSSASTTGALSSTDWDTFNNKQSSLSLGNLTSSTTGVNITGGTGSVVGSGTTLNIQTATGSQPGLLSAADWTTFNGKQTAPFIPNNTGSETMRGYTFQNNSTTSTANNITASSATGTATARSVASTNVLTSQIRCAFAVSTPAANAQCGIRNPSAWFFVTSGFKFETSFAYTDSQQNTGARQFYGMTATTTAIAISSTVTVASLTNMIGIGSDAGDTALSIFHNAAGTSTKITLNATDFPANRGATASTDIFKFILYNAVNSTSVLYEVTNLTTGVVAQGTLSSNLPASTTALAFQAIRTSGSSSNACSFDLTKLICYSLT